MKILKGKNEHVVCVHVSYNPSHIIPLNIVRLEQSSTALGVRTHVTSDIDEIGYQN